MTDSFLRMIVPDITAEQITLFFKLKNDTKANISFNGKDDFVTFMGAQIRVDEKILKDNMEGLEKIGFKFTNSPNLFRVRAVGIFGRSEITLTAIVLLPEKAQEQQTSQGQANPNEPADPDKKKENPVLFDPPIIIDISQS